MHFTLIIVALLTGLLTGQLSAQQSSGKSPVCRIELRKPDTLHSGRTDTLAYFIAIEAGWHINSHQPEGDFAIATELKVDLKPAWLNGDLVYPTAIQVEFPYSDGPVAVYQDSIFVQIPVKVPADAPRMVIINGTLTYQACNDQVCLPPRRISFADSLQIR